MRTPNHPHASSPPRLNPRHRIFENKTLGRENFLFAFDAQFLIDRFECNQIDVRRRFAATFGDPRIVAEDAMFVGESREQTLIVGGFYLEISSVG